MPEAAIVLTSAPSARAATASYVSQWLSVLKHSGFQHATERSLWIVGGISVLVLALTPLLPRHGRPEEELVGAKVEAPQSAAMAQHG